MKMDLFPPNKSLLSLPVVHCCVGFLFLVAAIMSISILNFSSPLSFNLSQRGFENASNLFKAPMAVCLLSIPLLALLASNHRSVQTTSQMSLTTKQIALTSEQNLFANYYKHVDEFGKWCENFKKIGQVASRRKLHKKIFPLAQTGDFVIPAEILMEFNKLVLQLRDILVSAAGSNSLEKLAEIRPIYNNFGRRFFLVPPVYTEGERYVLDKDVLYFPAEGPRGFIKEQIDFIKVIDNILSFDPTYHATPLFYKLSSLSLSGVPTNTRMTIQLNFTELLG